VNSERPEALINVALSVSQPAAREHEIAALEWAAGKAPKASRVLVGYPMYPTHLRTSHRRKSQYFRPLNGRLRTFLAKVRRAGPHLAPRLLVAFGEQRERFESAAELQRYSGIAPVTERSGKKNWVHWRWPCPTFLRQTCIEWAAQTINKSFWAGAFYRQHRDQGSTHQAAVRALAYKWIRILYGAGRPVLSTTK
jgi:hypothetical protein